MFPFDRWIKYALTLRQLSILTTRIRRMTKGYVFTAACLLTFAAGVPHPSRRGGAPSFLTGGGGTPILPNKGDTPSLVRMGVNRLRSGQGYPGATPAPKLGLGLDGVPPPAPSGIDGVPHYQDWILHPTHQETEQHSEHSLCGGRCASYVHAGGRSCCHITFSQTQTAY